MSEHRLIDANALMEDINESLSAMTGIGIAVDGDWLWAKLNDAIEHAPTIEPEPHWIPCSERLPAYGEDVLISIGGYCNVGHIVPVNKEEQYNWYFSGWYHFPNDVDAWMPLPEPYKEDE